jgi:Flp pilus assembly pilin Flp
MRELLRHLHHHNLRLRVLLSDERGQDMVEYALLAGFVAVAVGALAPDMAESMSNIYSRLTSKLVEANG